MGHIIPDGDGLQQPTNAADTSLYIQRLFIGADCVASKAQSEQTWGEKQPTGKLCRLPSVWECVRLWITLGSVLQNVLVRFLVRPWCPSVHLERQCSVLTACFTGNIAAHSSVRIKGQIWKNIIDMTIKDHHIKSQIDVWWPNYNNNWVKNRNHINSEDLFPRWKATRWSWKLWE